MAWRLRRLGRAIGCGNDADGHCRIAAVVACETGESLDSRRPVEERVRLYLSNYLVF